jgi:uncharacterized protein YkwD
MLNLSQSKSRIAAICALAAIAGGAGSAATAHAAPAAADWTAVSSNTAIGTVPGTSVSLSGTQVWNTPTSRVDGSWPYFAGPAFSPALPKTDVIQISGAPGASYTLRFNTAVKDPILHLGSLGSTIAFTGLPAGTPVTRLSSEGGFTVSGSSVSGTPGNTILASGNSDASGSIRLTGSYTSVSFTATPNYSGPADGILVQLVAEAPTQGAPPPPPPSCAGADTPITQSTVAIAEDAITCLTNQERKKAGLPPLTVNVKLQGTARAHSQDMVQRRFYAHTNLNGVSECGRMSAAGYAWSWCGENIHSWPAAATANTLMYHPQQGWMTHLGPDGTLATNDHRNNILRPQFKEIGVGVAVGYYQEGPGSAGATATQDFGTPA